jgi:hypothetical protein
LQRESVHQQVVDAEVVIAKVVAKVVLAVAARAAFVESKWWSCWAHCNIDGQSTCEFK